MRALLFLFFLNLRGTVRRAVRRLKNPRYLALWIAVGLVGLWLLITVFSAREVLSAANVMGALVPFMMLGMLGASFAHPRAQHHLSFSSAEISFLFSGPFSRDHLLGYKLLQSLKTSAIAALIFAIWFPFYPGGYPVAFLAVWLALAYLSTLGLGIRFAWDLIAPRKIRRALLTVGLLILSLGVWQASTLLDFSSMLEAGSEGHFVRIATMIKSTWLGSLLLFPFEPFGQLFEAQSMREVGRWMLICLCLHAVLTILLFLARVDFRDTSIRTSEYLEKQMEKRRRGDFGSALSNGKRPRFSLPLFPRLGGSGALLWRQLLVGVRGLRGMLMTFLFPIAIVSTAFLFTGEFSRTFSESMIWMLIPWMTLVLSGSAITCDFRGDIGHMDTLKGLPIPPTAVVVGQVLPPTILIWTVQLLAIAGVAALGLVNPMNALLAAILLVPFNFILLLAENLTVLLFPIHPSRFGTGEISARGMIVFLIKIAVVGVTGLVAGGLGAALFYLSGSLAIGLFAATVILTLIGLGGIPVLARAYERFDLTQDTPAEEG